MLCELGGRLREMDVCGWMQADHNAPPRAFLAAIGWTDASASNAYFWLQEYVKRNFSRLHATALGMNNIEAQARRRRIPPA